MDFKTVLWEAIRGSALDGRYVGAALHLLMAGENME